MNIFSSTIGKIFGTDKAIASVIDNVSSGLDKLVYTNQEKADEHAKDVTEARNMIIRWMESTQGQNLARRLIALVIVFTWLLMYLSMMGLSLTGVWVESPVKFIESAKVIGNYAENMNGAVMLILAFYFAAPHMSSVVNAALNKFGGGK